MLPSGSGTMYGWVDIENECRWARRNAYGAMPIHDSIVLGRPPGVFPQGCLPLLVRLSFCGVNMHESVRSKAMPHTSTDELPATDHFAIHWVIHMHIHPDIRWWWRLYDMCGADTQYDLC